MSPTMTRAEQIAHARACDTEIAAAWATYWEVAAKIAPYRKAVRDVHKNYRLTEAQRAERIARHEAKIAPLQEHADALATEAWEMDAALYEGWHRFYLVQHIHNTQHCSSFRPTTRIGWLPDVSGLTEAEAVAEHGAILCTICFPTAPVEFTRGPQDPEQCAGSGQPIDRNKLTGREGAYYSPSGTCSACGQAVTLTSRGSGKARKHKEA